MPVTSYGSVEVSQTGPDDGPVVLLFPGGHCTAATPLGADLYAELGYRVLTFSRPGYGRTSVGDLSAAEFVPVVAEVCELLGITEAAAAVGISFGGLQAVEVAVGLPRLAARLVLHSCAPSSIPYPDSAVERIAAPLAFGRRPQRLVWSAVRRLIPSDHALRIMMSSLSTLPTSTWWHTWTPEDRAGARATLTAMDSGSGFVTDLRQAGADRAAYRAAVMRSIPCPTLVTASRHDGGVSYAHAEDFGQTIPDVRLVETSAESHFYWLGPGRPQVSDSIRAFLSD